MNASIIENIFDHCSPKFVCVYFFNVYGRTSEQTRYFPKEKKKRSLIKNSNNSIIITYISIRITTIIICPCCMCGIE